MPIYDEVGYWTEMKLDIVRQYSEAYARILAKQSYLHHVYVDAFAGAGEHISRTTGEKIPGSPYNALFVEASFKDYYFIEIEPQKAQALDELVGDRADVHILCGDCNVILLNDVFPKIRYEDYRRGLCFLDPYGLDLHWPVIEKAGKMESIEIFLNFPIMDINRNVLRRDPEKADPKQQARLTNLWGDRSWREAAYQREAGLFGEIEQKRSTEVLVKAFRKRLGEKAGFKFVPEPVPMRNVRQAVMYYLFFAGPNETGAKIAEYIFNKYRGRNA